MRGRVGQLDQADKNGGLLNFPPHSRRSASAPPGPRNRPLKQRRVCVRRRFFRSLWSLHPEGQSAHHEQHRLGPDHVAREKPPAWDHQRLVRSSTASRHMVSPEFDFSREMVGAICSPFRLSRLMPDLSSVARTAHVEEGTENQARIVPILQEKTARRKIQEFQSSAAEMWVRTLEEESETNLNLTTCVGKVAVGVGHRAKG